MHLLYYSPLHLNFQNTFFCTRFYLYCVYSFCCCLRPQEIQVREMASYCLWQSLRMDPSTPVVLAKYVGTNSCSGASFRSQLWQTRKVVRPSFNKYANFSLIFLVHNLFFPNHSLFRGSPNFPLPFIPILKLFLIPHFFVIFVF